MRKPFYWKARGAWFVKTGSRGNQRLHENREEAYKIWAEMQKVSAPESPLATFAVIAENFLRHVLKTNTKKTFRWRADFLASACNSFGAVVVRELKPYHVTRWLETETTWGTEAQRGAISTVKRCLNWAMEEGLLDSNPLAKVKKPPPKRREGLISDDEHQRMMLAEDGGRKSSRKKTSRRDSCFRQVLVAMKHTGCRPGVIGAVRIEDVADGAWIIHQHKTRAKTGKPLTVYLSPCLQTLTRLATGERTSGPLFLNSLGKPWTANAIRCRMKALRKKLGLSKTTIAYAYRHTYITQAMVNGNDVATVAELIGHSDLKMISQHYGHLDKQKEHLKQAAARAVKKQA